jgi:hypothetical protein
VPAPPATPLAAARLLAAAGRLRPLLDELARLTGTGHAWGLRVLRRNVEIALRSPETLASAENQLDFVEELAEAVWGDADPGFRLALPAGPSPEATRGSEERRQAIVAHLGRLADELCGEVEAWQRLLSASGSAAHGDRLAPGGNPQSDHRS